MGVSYWTEIILLPDRNGGWKSRNAVDEGFFLNPLFEDMAGK